MLFCGDVLAQAAPKDRRVLLVGPTRDLKAPSAAAATARNGDHIKIDAATYRDCAVWRASDLLIEGVGGTPHVRDVTCENQAIWFILGSRVTVRNIEFSGAHATYNNGAGIKFMGSTLTVHDSKFHHNENGILTAPDPTSAIRIYKSEFTDNGKCEPDCAHGIYIGKVARLTVTGSTFKHQHSAHHIKSRALMTELVNNHVEDGLDGTASFSVDLPNGGTAVIRQNYFQKGPQAENHLTMISIGEEGATNPGRGVYIGQNSFLSSNPQLGSFVWNRALELPVVLEGNRFLGDAAMKLKGPGKVLP